jgi:ADP-ribose pyrophosphatase YjhB (NUDIX family)
LREDTNETCGAVIIDKSGRYMLIVKESPFEAGEQTKWGIPKGKFKVGETLFECISREVCEETGVELLKNDFVKLRQTPSKWHISELKFQRDTGERVSIKYYMIDLYRQNIPLSLGNEIEIAKWMYIPDLINDVYKDKFKVDMRENTIFRSIQSLSHIRSIGWLRVFCKFSVREDDKRIHIG